MSINTKFQEIDFNLNKLFNNLTDLVNQLPNMNSISASKINVTPLAKQEDSSTNLSSVVGSKLNIDSFYKEFNDFRIKLEDDVKSINYKIKLKIKGSNNDASNRNTEDHNDFNNQNNPSNLINSDSFKPIDMSVLNNPNSSINHQFIVASINQLQENDKLVLQNLSYKVSREELEKLQRLMGMEIERVVCQLIK